MAQETVSANEGIASAMQELTASMQEMSAQAQQLSDMASSLQNATNRFTVGGEKTPTPNIQTHMKYRPMRTKSSDELQLPDNIAAKLKKRNIDMN